MNKNIKLNVLIPTRERADTLFHSLRTVVTQNYENLSIIVSDNFSQDNTKAIVESFNDPRIKYLNTGKRISMSANWEVALSAVTDGWVTFLGDDDGLLPGSLKKVAQLLDTTKAQAIRSSTCTYFYPGVNQDKKWRLVVQANTGVEVRDANVWLAKALNGHADYPDLPMLYNGGFISHALLMESKGGDGKFFQSSIPDIYSAVACASIVEGYIYSKEPFAMFGNSKHSGGNSMFYGSKAQRDAVLNSFCRKAISPFTLISLFSLMEVTPYLFKLNSMNPTSRQNISAGKHRHIRMNSSSKLFWQELVNIVLPSKNGGNYSR